GEEERDGVRRTGERLPALPPRALRRVQPGVRPRHALRPAIGRPHRVDPDVDAAARRLALRLEARAGLSRGKALHGLPQAARLGLRADNYHRPVSHPPVVWRANNKGGWPMRWLFAPILLAFLLMSGCSSTVLVTVPPRADLKGYGTLGVVDFTSNSGGAAGARATQQLQEQIQAAQPGTRFIELGSRDTVLAAVGRNQLDADA